jgi:hypothetical protein
MTGDVVRLAAWRLHQGSARRPYWNLVSATRRLERKLNNSMAHTARPRAADLARWRAMQAKLEENRAEIARQDAEFKPDA